LILWYHFSLLTDDSSCCTTSNRLSLPGSRLYYDMPPHKCYLNFNHNFCLMFINYLVKMKSNIFLIFWSFINNCSFSYYLTTLLPFVTTVYRTQVKASPATERFKQSHTFMYNITYFPRDLVLSFFSKLYSLFDMPYCPTILFSCRSRGFVSKNNWLYLVKCAMFEIT